MRGALPLVGYGGREDGRRIYEHEAVSNVRTNGGTNERAELPFGRTELQRGEGKGRAESNGPLELLLAAMRLLVIARRREDVVGNYLCTGPANC